MSVTVVRMGPEASAGSRRMSVSTSGRRPPTLTATMVLIASAAPTTSPPHSLPFPITAAHTRRPQAPDDPVDQADPPFLPPYVHDFARLDHAEREFAHRNGDGLVAR